MPFGGVASPAKKNKSGIYSFPSSRWGHVHSSSIEFVKYLMTVSPDQRPTASEALNHPWITGVDPETPKFTNADVTRPLEPSRSHLETTCLSQSAVSRNAKPKLDDLEGGSKLIIQKARINFGTNS
jgi:serine/threonine protein kinase